MSPELGTRLGGYRVDGVVGRGGMGVVYQATEVVLERPVALKLIAPEFAHDKTFRERFLRESRLAASLDHPGILPVYAAGEAEGELYLASRFVDGIDLRALLDTTGPLPPERALTLVGQVADALDAAHARNLVHRDVKPGNVLVDGSDHCYLCDFGLTKQLGVGGTTVTGGLAGSLDYLAPEQIRRGEIDGRTDQYALACVLYECLAGAPPFRRETEAQTLWAHMQESPAPLASYRELDRVFARALAKDAEERYESCDAFVDDARAALGLGPSRVSVRRRRRNRCRGPRRNAALERPPLRCAVELGCARRSGFTGACRRRAGRQHPDGNRRLEPLDLGAQLERRRRDDLAHRRTDTASSVDVLGRRDAQDHRRRLPLTLGGHLRGPGLPRRAGNRPGRE